MAARTNKDRRTEWHLANGKWTRSLGNRGGRVRLFQRRKGGVFFRAVWVPGQGMNVKSLGVTDRTEADRLGRELLRRLLVNEVSPDNQVVLLGPLVERYLREAVEYLDNKPVTRQATRSSLDVMVSFFGADYDVCDLTSSDIAAYTQRRRAGGIVRSNGAVAAPVRQGMVLADVKALCTVLKWATMVWVSKGKRLLAVHPLAGIKIAGERNPKRPVATWERFQKTCVAMQALAAESEDGDEQTKWDTAEVALVVIEATGRRRSAVCQLLWSDIDFRTREIRWRAESDKRQKEWRIPMPDNLASELRAFQRRSGVRDGYVFRSPKDPTKPLRGDVLAKLIRKAEAKANLPKLEGGVTHPYRRKWATERKHHSLKDVAAAGGWSNAQTLLTCYQHADQATMLQVMNESRKVREIGVVEE